MGLFKKWFGRKEAPAKPDGPTENLPIDLETPSTFGREFIEDNCELCSVQIGYDKRKKIHGHLFHRSCFKQHKQKMRLTGKVI